MARTLSSKMCVRCGGTVVRDEETRYVGPPSFWVAKAHCQICDTRYLALMYRSGEGIGDYLRDLVYQTTQSDEPGVADVPNYVMVFRAENVTTASKMVQPHGGQGKVVTIQTIETIVVTPRQ